MEEGAAHQSVVKDLTPKVNKTQNEGMLKQDVLWEGKPGIHEQSSSEITQFNQRDFQSTTQGSYMDDA